MRNDGDDDGKSDEKIVELRPDQPRDGARVYEHTLIANGRRYRQERCPHKGPYTVDNKLALVECGDCGAMLNPIYVLEMLAAREAYWNMRQRDLKKYLDEINEEIKDRTRTRCTHCGNMTVIRLKGRMPQTWVPDPY